MLSSLLPNPLHPAIVHLPIALAVLLPLVIIGALVAINRGATPRMAWTGAIVAHALLAGTAWLSLTTGEPAAEQAEKVVAEAPIESHEEAAEAFLALAAGALAISLLGVRKDKAGQLARVAATVSSVVLLGAGWNVGHSGGQLVYKYGAGAAYATPGSAVAQSKTATDRMTGGGTMEAKGGDDDDDDEK
jgi:hypothetical protein